MPSQLEKIDYPAIAARAQGLADRYTLPLSNHTWRGNPGDYAGTGAGSSLDFQDHRNYLPGDDPRHINWQAYARTGDYTLKLYREEVRPIVEIIMDVSGSMFSVPDKAERAIELLYFSFYSAERVGASAKVFLTNGPFRKAIETHTFLSHHWAQLALQEDSVKSSEAPTLGALPFRQRSLRVFISDLLFNAAPEHSVQALQRNHGRALILCPFSPSESNPDWNGNYEFIDSEDRSHHDRRVDPPLLKRYIETYRRHFDRWKAASIRAQTPFARISSLGSFEEAVRKEAVPSGAIQLA
ncbi:MAG: DUF58 domain-containing protein [Verrucomicrobiales bacterium]|nr:DUF58 domain-containing protein [Verrucomicrobiales bacterium]